MTTLLLAQAGIFVGSGPAAYYDPSYSRSDWDGIYWRQAEWGHAIGPPAGWGEYHCAHAAYDVVGVRLLLRSGGQEFVCVTSDTVQDRHKAQWFSRWGIEGSWELFTALPDPSHVEVYELGLEPFGPPAPEPDVRHFQTTGYEIKGAFLEFFEANGGIEILGLPLTDRYDCELETGEAGTCQVTERSRLELHPSGEVLLGRLGAELLEGGDDE